VWGRALGIKRGERNEGDCSGWIVPWNEGEKHMGICGTFVESLVRIIELDSQWSILFIFPRKV